MEKMERKVEFVNVSEYAAIWGLTSLQGIRSKCQKGKFKTAKKEGRIWLIDKNEHPPKDERIVSGLFIGWRKTGKPNNNKITK